MEIKTFKEFLYDLSLDMDDSDKINLIYECLDYVPENIYYNDKYNISEIFGDNAAEKVLDALEVEQYNREDEYFTIDAYGYIQTFNNIDEYYDIPELMEYNRDAYLGDYGEYLSDVLHDIDNKEDLVKFKELVEEEELVEDFIDEINEKSLTLSKSRID